jgi:hypothetical protein
VICSEFIPVGVDFGVRSLQMTYLPGGSSTNIAGPGIKCTSFETVMPPNSMMLL